MADDKQSRDKQAHDADQRQRERAILEELERWDETEPPVDLKEQPSLETDLLSLEYPATGAEITHEIGDQTIETETTAQRVTELLADTDDFEDPETVRLRVQRPTIAAAMTAIQEAVAEHQELTLDQAKRTTYEKTFRALKNIDADDNDEGITAIKTWILDRIEQTGTLPKSRAVRREAAEFCRENGYPISANDWLGI